MSNVNERAQQAREIAGQLERAQNIKAMDRLVRVMGGRTALGAWLAGLPESVQLNARGEIAQASVQEIAADQEAYDVVVKVFAAALMPVLRALDGQ